MQDLSQGVNNIAISENLFTDLLQPAIDKAMSINDRLVFLDINVDEKEHVYPMQIKLGGIDEMWLRKGVKA